MKRATFTRASSNAFGRAFGDLVDAAVDVRVVLLVVVDQRVDHGLRLLRGRGRVEIDEAFAARRRLRENRKIGGDALRDRRVVGAGARGDGHASLACERRAQLVAQRCGREALDGRLEEAERDHALGAPRSMPRLSM